MKKSGLLLGVILLTASVAQGAVSTFDNLSLAPDSYWNGADESGGFTSGDAYFYNYYDASWGSWEGWAYSNKTDTTTAGWANQYSAITGSGVNGSANYGVAYDGSGFSGIYPHLSFDTPVTVAGAYFTNTTYAYTSMRDGDGVAKKFDAGDWFKLDITGFDALGQSTGTIEFYLATGTDLLDQWEWADLSGLGAVKELKFALSSSDVGTYGINTPTYFAMDNLSTVPIPGAVWLFGCGLMALFGIRKKVK